MKGLNKTINWISNLKVAISILLLIGTASALGTFIPQNESYQNYLNKFDTNPWLGLINGKTLLILQLDHVYSSYWFLSLLFLLAISLTTCSWKRQWPMLKGALKWIDYKLPRQIKKLSLSQIITVKDPTNSLEKLSIYLRNNGWAIKQNANRFAARQGAIGRVGPPLIHMGMILLMLGATLGNLNGEKLEKFLAPGRSIDLISPKGENQLTIKLNKFKIDRDPAGRPEQFISELQLIKDNEVNQTEEISVNNPLRYKGITIYQADWSLAAITIEINKTNKLQLPLKPIPELGDQIWGVVIPTSKEKDPNPILLSVSTEQGPVKVFDSNGVSLATLRPGNKAKEINNIPISVLNIIPSSGLLLKRDPGVPFVYSGFAIILLGGFLSVLSTKQIWVISDNESNLLFIGGLSNRNLSGLANELPKIIELASIN